MKYLQEGFKIEDYTLYKANKGMVKDKEGNIVDNSKQIKVGQYIIFGTCDDCINAGTFYHNIFWSTYIGPWNPVTYKNKESYDFSPKKLSEYPAIL